MTTDFNKIFDAPSYETWQKLALKALRLEELSKLEDKLNKKSCEGITLKALSPKKGSLVLVTIGQRERIFAREVESTNHINSDVDGGLSTFFTQKKIKTDKKIFQIQKIEKGGGAFFGDLILFDVMKLNATHLKKYLEQVTGKTEAHFLINTSLIHNAGGSIVQEVAFALSMAKFCYENFTHKKIYFQFSLDSKYFENIAKLRAVRYLWETLLESENLPLDTFSIISENSHREQTLFDPWSNMLRNTISSSAAFLGGADILTVLSYDCLATTYGGGDLSSMGQRQSRNILHILGEEAAMGRVIDPAAGSYTIEALSHDIAEKSFELFKQLENDGGILNNLEGFSRKVAEVSELRFAAIQKRKDIVTGINNFANPEDNLKEIYGENLNIKQDQSNLFPLRRCAMEFEFLRSQFSALNITKKIGLCVYGTEAKLSGRIMFCQNYFETAGLECELIFFKEKKMKEQNYYAVVYISADEDYSDFLPSSVTVPSFIAGKKIKSNAMTNLFAGQNIYETLSSLLPGEKA